MPSPIQPPPTVVDTRNETTKAISTAAIAGLISVYISAKSLWSPVWAHPTKTPVQTIAELGTGAAVAFDTYTKLGTYAATTGVELGIDFSLIDSSKSGTILIPAMPDGYSVTPQSDGSSTPTLPPPVTPTGLTATAATTLPGKINLTWTAALGAIGYTIQRSEDAGATFIPVMMVKNPTTGGGFVATIQVTTWTDDDKLPAGTQYKIAAVMPSLTTGAGTSAFSAAVTL